MRMNAAMDQADRLARFHVKQQGKVGPDRDAWVRLWAQFGERRGNEWTDAEIRIIYAYAMAALRYDHRHPGSQGLWSSMRFGLSAESEVAA